MPGFVQLYLEFITIKHKPMGLCDTIYLFQDGSVNILVEKKPSYSQTSFSP